jgi:hypothetical protein
VYDTAATVGTLGPITSAGIALKTYLDKQAEAAAKAAAAAAPAVAKTAQTATQDLPHVLPEITRVSSHL